MRKNTEVFEMESSFDTVRTQLERQYQPMLTEPGSGLDLETIKKELDNYEALHRGEPLIRLRAGMLELILTRGRIGIDSFDCFADHLEGKELLRQLNLRRKEQAENIIGAAVVQSAKEFSDNGIFVSWLDQSHTTPDWHSLLTLGPSGLRDRALAAQKNAAAPEAEEFFSAVARVFEAMRKLILRFAELAETKQLPELAETMHFIACRPPETLRQALQLALIYDTCQELELEPVRSQGRFDQLYIPFLRHDLARRILTRDTAKELLKFYWTKFYAQMHPNGKNFCFGGLAAPGVDGCNELTGLCFEVHHELNRINPKLSFRVHPGTPEKNLLQVAECVRAGRTAVVFSNDMVAFDMFRRRGKAEQDLCNYVLIGCYEPAVMGREMCCSMSAWGNLVKPLEAVLNNGCTFNSVRLGPECRLPGSAAEFEAEYYRQLDAMLTRVMENTRAYERAWKEINPSPLLSGTMPDCIRSGRDVSDAGTRYNSSGVMCCGLGTVVDSLMAVKTLVDERKLCTMTQLAGALRNNWQGCEALRLQALKRSPKWGNAHPLADAAGKRLAAFLAEKINKTPNARGGSFQLGLWSIDHNFTFGQKCGATPDGRFAGEPLSRNLGASIGMEKNGPLALMHSAAVLDQAESPDGAVLDILLHPSAVSGPDGAKVITRLIRSYFASGGLAIQFNIMDAEELREAQREPEKHSDVQVRVCGWNSRFIDLSEAEQNAFICQAEAQE